MTTPWGRKAAALYDSSYAAVYRRHDDEIVDVEAYLGFARWLQRAGSGFGHAIDVLDLGCGTGRFFSAVPNVRSLVGIDASAAMLERARHPLDAERLDVPPTLVHADFLAHEFGASQFDLIYSIGVLAEHTPLDEAIVAKVARWLRPRGRFAFTTVHPDSPSIPRTMRRLVGRAVEPLARGPLRRGLRARLMSGGLYADEQRVRDLLAAFRIESLERLTSEAHLHVLCVAERIAG